MPTKLEDVATTRSQRIFEMIDSGHLNDAMKDIAQLEKELHVARGERDDALTHERDAQKGAKTNAEVARRLAASNNELRLDLEKANQKCQLAKEQSDIILHDLNELVDTFGESALPHLARQVLIKILSKAAKTL